MGDKSIQKAFIGTLLLILVCMGGVTWVFNRLGDAIERRMIRKFNNEQLLLAGQAKLQIEDKFKFAASSLEFFRRLVDLQGFTLRLATNNWKGIDAWALQFSNDDVIPFMAKNHSFVRFALTDADGNPLLYVVDITGIPHTLYAGKPSGDHRETLSAASVGTEHGKTFISRPHEAKLKDGQLVVNPNVMDLSIPLSREGKELGRILLSVDMASIQEIVSGANPVTGSHDHRWIYAQNGELVYCSLIMSQDAHEAEIRHLINKPSGTYEFAGHGPGTRDLLSTVPLEINGNKWTLVAEMTFEDVMGIIHNLQRIRTLVLFLLLALAGGGGLVLYWNIVRRLTAEEKERHSAQMRAQDEKFRMMTELAPDPIFLLDSGLTILDCNSGAVATLKRPKEELIGVPFFSLAEDGRVFINVVRAEVRTKGAVKLEQTMVDGTGTRLYFENNTALFRFNNTVYYQTYLRNVTERKELEVILRKENENLDKIMSSIGAGLAVFNQDLTMEWTNERYREMAEILGKTLAANRYFMCPNEELTECTVRRSFESRTPQRDEKLITSPAGETFHFLHTATPILETDGKVSKIIEMVVDITASKSLEEQLLQSEKLASIGELAAGIAHELNNPMSGIIGYSEFLMGARDIPKESRKDAERIHTEAIRCSKIIQNLLTFARRHRQKKSAISINEVIDVTVDIVDYEFKVNNVILKKEFDRHLKTIIGDPYQLQQVLLNILNNAYFYLKEQPGGRNITLITRNTEKGIRVEIRNNGPKIEIAVMGKIFDPFFTTKEVGKGTGLGLSVSHGIIKAHKGNISATNTDEGVTFLIDLPAAPQETKEQE